MVSSACPCFLVNVTFCYGYSYNNCPWYAPQISDHCFCRICSCKLTIQFQVRICGMWTVLQIYLLREVFTKLALVQDAFPHFLKLPWDTLSAEVSASTPPYNADVACETSSWPGRGPGTSKSKWTIKYVLSAVLITVVTLSWAQLNVQVQNNCDGQQHDHAWFQHFLTLMIDSDDHVMTQLCNPILV